MIVTTLSVGQLQTNCYIIGDREEGTGAIIDPGGDASRILQAASRLNIQYVINTHAHFDHMLANREVLVSLRKRQDTSVELIAHREALPLLATGGGASVFGLSAPSSPDPDRLVEAGDRLSLGTTTLEVLYTPGHSPGSITLYCSEAQAAFVGDVLFRRGVGRADLQGGDWNTLIDSITRQLFALPKETIVYPGHGPATTIEDERRLNPFLT
jgi:glyoxylase-like metal-dependent hydrolase (beta-lactamase superfamily II)